MPDRRQHRGSHPEDPKLFAPEFLPSLRAAVSHLSWLLSHDYADASALKLVGDHFQFTERQRMAVRRCACSDPSRLRRHCTEVPVAALEGRRLIIDGYNLLTNGGGPRPRRLGSRSQWDRRLKLGAQPVLQALKSASP